MLTQTILNAFASLLSSVINLFPKINANTYTSFYNNVIGHWTDFIVSAKDFSHYFPLQALYNCFELLLAAFFATTVIKVIRIIISNISGGGGAVS